MRPHGTTAVKYVRTVPYRIVRTHARMRPVAALLKTFFHDSPPLVVVVVVHGCMREVQAECPSAEGNVL